MHGIDFWANHSSQCCPHGITKPQGPPEDCCVDDLDKSPYRMNYIDSKITVKNTVMDFNLAVVPVSNVDFDKTEPAICDKMTLDWAQIQLCESRELPRYHRLVSVIV
jgi:hypothetical protein